MAGTGGFAKPARLGEVKHVISFNLEHRAA